MSKEKILNPRPRPIECDNCKSRRVRLTQNSVLYGRNYGTWPLIWFCDDCHAATGCHADTDIPLGTMATREVRQARKLAHEAFDPLWKKHRLASRYKAYEWLACNLKINVNDCHIGHFDEQTCARVVEICSTVKIKRGLVYDP